VPNRGYRALAVIVVAAALSGCAQMEQITQQGRQEQAYRNENAARRTCEARGITSASPLYTQCVEANTELITDQQRTSAENLPQGGGLPTYGADRRTTDRTCLPVGSQPGAITC
jgi:hypothetical protein